MQIETKSKSIPFHCGHLTFRGHRKTPEEIATIINQETKWNEIDKFDLQLGCVHIPPDCIECRKGLAVHTGVGYLFDEFGKSIDDVKELLDLQLNEKDDPTSFAYSVLMPTCYYPNQLPLCSPFTPILDHLKTLGRNLQVTAVYSQPSNECRWGVIGISLRQVWV